MWTQIAATMFLGLLLLALLGTAMAKGVVASFLWVVPIPPFTISAGLAALGWRAGRQASDLITVSIQDGFRAHRLTSGWSRRA
jgi:hypothetical protein